MTDTARYADVLLPATTFLEGYDLARGYGPISLRLGKPVIEPVGESRPNADVFGELLDRLDLARRAIPPASSRRCCDVLARLPGAIGDELREHGRRDAAVRRPADSVRRRLAADARRQGRSVSRALDAEAPAGLYGYQPDPATPEFPADADFAGQRAHDHVDARRSCRAPKSGC